MSLNIIDDIVMWFLELYDDIDRRARDGEVAYKSLGEKFRSYSRSVTESMSESPHEALLFMLSKAGLKCVKRIVGALKTADITLHEPQGYIEEVLKPQECSVDKLAYATLFLAALGLYSKVRGIEVDSDALLDAIKGLFSDAARIDSPLQEFFEDLYSGLKRAAEASLSESYS